MADRRREFAPNIGDEQFALADVLLSLVPPGFLTLKSELHKSDYVPLQAGRLKRNIDAVSIAIVAKAESERRQTPSRGGAGH